MKKMLALTLALLMALTCVTAFADTIYEKTTIDSEVLTDVLVSFGVNKYTLTGLEPIVAVLNAMGVNVTTVEDGAQIDLDFNGTEALSVGFAVDEKGVTVGSTLFPNYLVTATMDTIKDIAQQATAASVEGKNEAAGINPAALQETFGAYFQKWFEACAAAGKPGDPVTGEYEFEGYTFDTMVPVTVDIPAISEATKTLMDDIMADSAAMGMIETMAKNALQSTGKELKEGELAEQMKAAFDEFMKHFPETSTSAFYINDGTDAPFYMTGESVLPDGYFTYDMLFVDQYTMDMGYVFLGDKNMEARFTMADGAISTYFRYDGLYVGYAMTMSDEAIAMDVYFMDEEHPVMSSYITHAAGGERTLSLDTAGKTVVSIEDAMSGNGEEVQGLLNDIMNNGLTALMGVMKEVPEIAQLMSAFSGAAA